MAIIDNIKGTITKTGKTAVKKTKDLAGIAKITADIEETKGLIKGVYEEIGKKYCEIYDKETAGEDFAVNVATVENLTKRLEALRDERLALRGKVKCEGCGKGISDEYKFCPHCGTPLPERTAGEMNDDISEEDDDIDIEVEIADTLEIADDDEEVDDE